MVQKVHRITQIGTSDGRCVQKAGTCSAQDDDLCLLEVPRSRSTIAKIYPKHDFH